MPQDRGCGENSRQRRKNVFRLSEIDTKHERERNLTRMY